ncbi:ComGF family competence protein [Halalkalibacter alkalisediminis]|uniref:ComGF family competence protein n=1 Tax=Halalkalibacter alkalisediminis TaxID=935616 RepID=A0ABV6NLT2_9BACI|nr:ComGF family competence protein [Halalkalibacter alkalisediminis]
MNIVCWLRIKKGFTLIEVLLVLSLFLLVVSFFTPFFLTVTTGYQVEKVTFQQVTMFYNHISQDIKLASDVKVEQGSLILRREEEKNIEIRLLPSGQVRRTSDGEGNVLLLEDVQTFSCRIQYQLLRCKVVIRNLDSFNKSFLLPHKYEWEGS